MQTNQNFTENAAKPSKSAAALSFMLDLNLRLQELTGTPECKVRIYQDTMNYLDEVLTSLVETNQQLADTVAELEEAKSKNITLESALNEANVFILNQDEKYKNELEDAETQNTKLLSRVEIFTANKDELLRFLNSTLIKPIFKERPYAHKKLSSRIKNL